MSWDVWINRETSWYHRWIKFTVASKRFQLDDTRFIHAYCLHCLHFLFIPSCSLYPLFLVFLCAFLLLSCILFFFLHKHMRRREKASKLVQWVLKNALWEWGMKRGESARERGSWFDVQNSTVGEGEKRGQERQDPAGSSQSEGNPLVSISVFIKGERRRKGRRCRQR